MNKLLVTLLVGTIIGLLLVVYHFRDKKQQHPEKTEQYNFLITATYFVIGAIIVYLILNSVPAGTLATIGAFVTANANKIVEAYKIHKQNQLENRKLDLENRKVRIMEKEFDYKVEQDKKRLILPNNSGKTD